MTDLDAESRRILELARDARTPSAQDKARVEQRFAIALGLSATAASGTAATAAHAANGATAAKSAAGVATLKWWVGGALVVGAVASYVTLSTAPATRPSRPIAAAPTPAAPTPAAPRPEPPVPLAKPSVSPEPAVLAEPAVSPERQPTAQPVAATPRAAQHTAQRVEPRRPTARGDSLAAELELLHRAQTAWRAREAQSALALLDEHRARYPHSQLQLERDALQVLTLCELGRKDQASQLARNVLTHAPNSPLRASLEQSCAFK